MNKKIAAGLLAAILGVTGISMPAAVEGASANSTYSLIDPLDAIRIQNASEKQQENIEEEENMPAEEPDPLVFDNSGAVVPASAATWTENSENQEETGVQSVGEAVTQDEEDVFSDGNANEAVDGLDSSWTETSNKDGEPEEVEFEDEASAGNVSGTEENPDNENDLLTSQSDEVEELQPEENKNASADENAVQELTQEPEQESGTSVQQELPREDFSAGETENFSDGSAAEGKQGKYQTVTLKIKNGQDITAPLNTLFLELKDKATDETPYKIVVPSGNYKLTGTLCMYSNMYLYARGATITKTSVNKHILLRLGNTLESEGGYAGYRNVVIEGGTWNFNYQVVENKDEPGGFVGFCIGHVSNVTIKNATFLNNLKSHFLEFGGVKNARVTGCTFRGYYKNYVNGGQECIQIDCCTDEGNVFPQYQPYDGSTCEDFVIDGNTFQDVFAGVGTHSMMAGKTYKRITVTNNTFRNVKKRCIEFLNYEDSVAENNVMVNVGTGVDVSAVNLKNTHKTAGYNGGPDTKIDRGIRVSGNRINLSKTTSIGGYSWVCCGIKIAGCYNMNTSAGVIPRGIYAVKGITVKNNQISGCGNGIRMTRAELGTLYNNQVTVKKTAAFSNFGISTEDSRGTTIQKNKVSGSANAGIYIYDGVFGKGSGRKNYISENSVSSVGGDGIYLQTMTASSLAEKNTVKATGGSGIRVRSGKNVSVLSNSVSSNKNHGIKIEYTTGGIRAKSNRTISNGKSGILVWKSKATEISGNRAEKNKGNGIYAYSSVIQAMKTNTFSGNAGTQAIYAKNCKGFTSVNRPSCKTITTRSTIIWGSASGNKSVTAYAQRSGKLTRLNVASVDKKKQFAIKIKKQKKKTVIRIVSKDKYGNTVSVSYTVK